MGELRTCKKDFVLIGGSQGYRPGIATGTIEQIGSAASGAAGAADIFEANGQAEAGEGALLSKRVVCQYRSTIGRCRGQCPQLEIGGNMGVLKIGCDCKGGRVIGIDEVKDRLVILDWSS